MSNRSEFSSYFSLSPLDYHAIEFNQLDTSSDGFLKAFNFAFAEAQKNISAIANSNEIPTFENTIIALEESTEKAEHVLGVFSNLLHAETNENLQELAKAILPKMASLSNDIYLNDVLFKKTKLVYEQRKQLDLAVEQKTLLEKSYKSFVRNGALLNDKQKQRLREIDQRLATITQIFGENILKVNSSYVHVIKDKSELKGLPESFVKALKSEAERKGYPESWVVTLDAPIVGPFLKYAENRELRSKIWKDYASRATNGETCNYELILEITRLRHERAKLLGYATHAHYVLEERMASDPLQVRTFLDQLLTASRSAAEQELSEMKRVSGLGEQFAQWDSSYYSEVLKKEKFHFDEEAYRPYFSLPNVIQGVFAHAEKLYGVTFHERKDLPVYHPDVQVFEVKDQRSKEGIGLFYTDFFPRPSKQGGAWMTQYLSQGRYEGKVCKPIVSIVCNFTKPSGNEPSLLRLMEVRTLFHEFGHALHGLLSQCQYRSLAGPNVYWDFVELPSQIMENWCYEKESLDMYAKHFQTGESLSVEQIERLKEVSRFQAGLNCLRQLSFGYLDMAWHAQDPSGIVDPEKFESETLKRTALFQHQKGTCTSASFSHIFSGGYSAGYYSYKWAEVLDADAFELFKEKGIFNKEVAGRFREAILSKGGTEHPMELYKRFRGREPDTKALLRRDGLI